MLESITATWEDCLVNASKSVCILIIIIALLTGLAACGDGSNIITADSTEGTTTTEEAAKATTEPEPTEPQLIEGYDDAIIIAADNSPDEWKSKAQFLCEQGELSDDLKIAIRKGNQIFKFAPGEYRIDGEGRHIYIGSKTRFVGAYKINQPHKLQDMLYPDPSYMAVFITTAELPSEEWCTKQDYGVIKVSGARDVVVDSIALSGYTVFSIDNCRSVKAANILVHNYRGEYPNGEWCNMGYGIATGSFWVTGNNSDLEISHCQIQCSSHHGINFHSVSNTMVTKNVHIVGTRALYCGSGMLRGEFKDSWNIAAQLVPETNGHGFLDWSVAFDLCERQNIQNMLVEDCYALDGWKAGFYTEPEGTGGPVTDIKLIRCRSDYAGRRTEIPGSEPKAVVIKEGENANFFFQGGYFEDCVSVGGQKSGWYIHPNRPKANATGDALAKLINCGDMGSVISLATEGGSSLHAEGFWSLNAEEEAIWLYGSGDFRFTDTVILVKNQKTPPIVLGKTQRLFFRYTRDPVNALAIAPRAKYDKLRVAITNSLISGTVYDLPEGIDFAFIPDGSSFNGAGDPNDISGNIKLIRDNTTEINVEDYLKVD